MRINYVTRFMTLLFSLILLSQVAVGYSGEDKKAVYKAGLNYIEGFYEGDPAKLKASLKPTLKKFGFYKNKDTGKFSDAIWMSYERALEWARTAKEKGNLAKPGSPKKVEVIDMTNKIAAVKISAWWGVDYMLLSKQDGKWWIEEIIWEGPSLESAATKDDKMAVKRATLNYVEGFYEGDASKLKAALKPTMFKFGWGYDKKNGKYREGRQMKYEQAIYYANNAKEKGWIAKPDAIKKAEVLDVMTITALTKVTATWGVDYMLLAKNGDDWKIEQILWAGLPTA